MKYLTIMTLLLPLVVHGAEVHPDAGSTIMSSLKIPIGARQVAIGSQGSAFGNDVFAMLWNPAAIRDIKGINIALEHASWLLGLKQDFVGVAMPLGPGAIGLAVRSFYLGGIEARSYATAEPEYHFAAFDLFIELVYALSLGPELDLGLGWNMLYSEIDHYDAKGSAIDLGFRYHLPRFGLELGFALQNFELSRMGIGNQISYDSEKYELPMTYRIGASWQKDEDGLLVALEGSKPIDGYWAISLGGEYPVGWLDLRAGVNIRNGTVVPSFGLGYQEGIFAVDLAILQPVQELNDISSRLGLQLTFE